MKLSLSNTYVINPGANVHQGDFPVTLLPAYDTLLIMVLHV